MGRGKRRAHVEFPEKDELSSLSRSAVILLLLGLLALGLAAVHMIAGCLRFLDVIPRSRCLSLASGVSAVLPTSVRESEFSIAYSHPD